MMQDMKDVMTVGMKAWKAEIAAKLAAAWAMPSTAKIGPCGGCGRVYVSVSGGAPIVNAVAAAAKKMGLTFLRRAYGTSGNVIYVGYDNASGALLAKGEAVAAALTAAGIPAYMDAVGD